MKSCQERAIEVLGSKHYDISIS